MTKTEFIKFVEELRNDIDNFENGDLDSFLEALERYTEDIDGYYNNTNQSINLDNVNWKVFADLIKGASIYE